MSDEEKINLEQREQELWQEVNQSEGAERARALTALSRILWDKSNYKDRAGASGSSQFVDPYPPNIAAPGRSCLTPNDKAILYGATMTCVGTTTAAKWTLDPGQVVGPAPKP